MRIACLSSLPLTRSNCAHMALCRHEDHAAAQQHQMFKNQSSCIADRAAAAQQNHAEVHASVDRSQGPVQQSNDANQSHKQRRRQKPESHLQKLAKQIQADKVCLLQRPTGSPDQSQSQCCECQLSLLKVAVLYGLSVAPDCLSCITISE